MVGQMMWRLRAERSPPASHLLGLPAEVAASAEGARAQNRFFGALERDARRRSTGLGGWIMIRARRARARSPHAVLAKRRSPRDARATASAATLGAWTTT